MAVRQHSLVQDNIKIIVYKAHTILLLRVGAKRFTRWSYCRKDNNMKVMTVDWPCTIHQSSNRLNGVASANRIKIATGPNGHSKCMLKSGLLGLLPASLMAKAHYSIRWSLQVTQLQLCIEIHVMNIPV